MIGVVVPSCTDAYLDACLASLEASDRGALADVVVVDSGLSPTCRARWEHGRFVDAARPFVYAQAINAGVAALPRAADVFILSDDVDIVTSQTRARLGIALRLNPAYGLLSLAIDGGVSNRVQRWVGDLGVTAPAPSAERLAFVAVVIRRRAWDAIGGLDERFTGYGWEDDDYCRRAVAAGWALGVLPTVVARHGRDGVPATSTFLRTLGRAGLEVAYAENAQRYREKWGA